MKRLVEDAYYSFCWSVEPFLTPRTPLASTAIKAERSKNLEFGDGMPIKLPGGTSMCSLATKAKYNVRNILSYEEGHGYGLRIILSSVSTGGVNVLGMLPSPKNPVFLSLRAALGLSDKLSGKRAYEPLIEKLMELDLLTISGGIGKNSRITHAEPGTETLDAILVRDLPKNLSWAKSGVTGALISPDGGDDYSTDVGDDDISSEPPPNIPDLTDL